MNKSTRYVIFGFLSLMSIYLAACNAALPAGAKALISADGKSAKVEFTGVVDSVAANQWVISGQPVLISAQTVIDGDFAAGDSVKVKATVTEDGAVTADRIGSPSADSSRSDLQSPPGAGENSNNKPDDKSDEKFYEFSGHVEEITADSWTVDGQVFMVNPHTEIKDNILRSDMVKVHYVINADGTFTATEIELADGQSQDSDQEKDNQDKAKFTGKVDAISPDSWTVDGKVFAVNAQTKIKDTIQLGDVVKVYYVTNTDGTFTATEIKLADGQSEDSDQDEDDKDKAKFTGKVDAITPDAWTIDGKVFVVNAQTKIKDTIQLGDMVKVTYFVNTDGTFTATEIELTDDDNEDKNEFTGKVEVITPDTWTVNGKVFAINGQTEIEDGILLGDVVKVHYSVNSDGTFTATEIELAGDNQAHNSTKKLTGVLEELTSTQATIGGVVVLITPQTKLDSGLVVGEMVKAEVVTNTDGTVTALEIKTFDNSKSDDDSSHNSNKGSNDSGHDDDREEDDD
jgi:hypothetical protein